MRTPSDSKSKGSKPRGLRQWLWKWHVIAGLFCLPVMAMLCITGSIYLFKDNYNDYRYQDARFVDASSSTSMASYQEQLETAQEFSDHPIMSVTLATDANQATQFRKHAKAHARNLVYVNPYTNEVSGTFEQPESLMYTVRKLHGELLLGQTGSLVVELVASWFIVLAITGICIWWPTRSFTDKNGSIRKGGFFTVRRKNGKRVFWRDMHSVLAFWMSIFMLIILAGGMPWTDLFGDNLKWVQKQTDTGYPKHWRNAKGLSSQITSENQTSLALDKIVEIANDKNLEGTLTIKLPQEAKGVFSVSNTAFWLEQQQVLHIDQYSGELIKELTWQQVGILMELRQVFMRLHQGEYGIANLVAVLLVAMTFFIAILASLISYFIRKPKGELGLPKPPNGFKPDKLVFVAIVILALLFPAFAISAALIGIVSLLLQQLKKSKAV